MKILFTIYLAFAITITLMINDTLKSSLVCQEILMMLLSIPQPLKLLSKHFTLAYVHLFGDVRTAMHMNSI